jgi:cytochrome c nitrite reductase small subunit
MDPAGPLFATPVGGHGVPWLHVLPILAAVPAAALLLWGLVRGLPLPALGGAAVLLSLAAFGFGGLLVLESSKRVEFCGSCHVMAPLAASLEADDGSLASTHFARGLVPNETACYTCHSGYGIWGTFAAKKAGMRHMIHTLTGGYELPLALNGPFDIDSCLGCHLGASRFRAVEMHQSPEVQQALVSREVGCTGACHPSAHPPSALGGGGPT